MATESCITSVSYMELKFFCYQQGEQNTEVYILTALAYNIILNRKTGAEIPSYYAVKKKCYKSQSLTRAKCPGPTPYSISL